jgi:hypothetical protein
MKNSDLTPFETVCASVELLSEQERLALIKLLSLSLDGPRLYTDADVKVIVQGALDEHNRRSQVISAAGRFIGKAN